jgi:hypothetical protein
MATCEIYLKERQGLDVDEEATFMALEAEMANAEAAGLKTQARQAGAELALRRLGLEPLSGQEFGVWRSWFPTAYRQSYDHCECGRTTVARDDFTNYRFDRVPVSVLELIQRCRDEFKLGWLEIRTPEQQRAQDPGLFGGKGPLTVLLGRWRESDDRLITFEEIRRGLKARSRRASAFTVQFFTGLAAFVGAVACAMIAVDPGPNLLVKNPILLMFGPSISVLVGVGMITALGFWKRRLRKAFAYAFS